MYEEEIQQLKAIFCDKADEELERALTAADGDVSRAMNQLLDSEPGPTTENPPEFEESESMVNMLRALEEEADLVVPYESASVAPAPSLPAPSADVAPRPKKTALASAPADPSSDPEELDEEEDNFIPPPELPAQPATVPKPVEDSINGKTFLVKILEPVGNYPTELVKTMIENIFKECKIDQSSFKYRSMRPRAEYEEQLAEWKYELTVNLDPKENTHRDLILKLYTFLEKFCYNSSLELHDQLMLEMPEFSHIMNNIVVHHTKLPVVSILLGNCPNSGLFYIRGHYVTHYNEYSNRDLGQQAKQRADQRYKSSYNTDGSHSIKAAGNQIYRSFADFEHDRRNLTLYFAVMIPECRDGLQFAGYKIVIPYSAIVQISVDLRAKKENSLFLKLKYPPQLWEATPKFQNDKRFMNLENTREWVRVLQFAGEGTRFMGCSKEALADCQWLQFQIPSTNEQRYGDGQIVLMEIVSRIMARSSAKVQFGAVFAQYKRLPVVHEVETIGSFRADYALKAMISRGSVITDQLFGYVETESPVEHLFFKYARWCFKQCRRACEEALENLLAAVDERRTFEILKAFNYLYQVRLDAHKRILLGDVRAGGEVEKLPKNCVMIRKVMITPLRRLFMPPEVMMTNRVVRQYGEEHALRCVFRDENGGKIQIKDFSSGFSADQQSAIINSMVHQTLTHGVEINNRTYQFLAWSNSQMRDHGCYMYAPIISRRTGEMKTSIEQMREWMGNFSNVKSVPKLMSRMGQCFTQAQPTILMKHGMWTVEPDFEGGEGHPETREKYCFSDGCGRIAPSAAKEVARILELDLIPSCFQVRFKGFKGIVVVDPTMDMVDNGPLVIFRKSQEKFYVDDDEEHLEIVKYSMPSPVCLNRPMIAILDWVSEAQSKELHKKLCRKVHYYLERELSTLGAMLLNEKIAAEQLNQRINLPIDFVRLRNCGFTLTDEPLLRKMLVSVYRYNIANHLTKLKIFIPGNQGRCMYGVVDETGLLQYGQVFIQYSPSIRHSSDRPKLHLGPVLITKNPCHVAGDCRMFEAVWQPSLAHLVDVVVFPRYGPRPHPDEMAGSDLDGDEYSVIFDPDVHFIKNEEAMIFPKSTAEEYDEPPQTEAMVHFFLKYLRQENIGKVSNAHLIMTDRRGLFDEIPNEIARKCSIAVDFPKSGQPAEALSPMEQSDRNPDYMATNFKPVYRSRRLNGQLYRKARKVEEVLELTEHMDSIFEEQVDKIICPEDVNLFEGNDQLKQSYRKLRNEYATRMQQLLDEYGITEEAAVVSGHIVSLKRLTAMEKDDYSFYHTDKIVELRYLKIFNHFRSVFLREFGEEEDLYEIEADGRKVLKTNRIMYEKARRWYHIAYVDNRQSNRAPGPCKSFPWVVWDVLAAFKREMLLSRGDALQRENPIAEVLEEEMVHFVRREVEQFKQFDQEIRHQGGVVARYQTTYGEQLTTILFVLSNWLNKEDIFTYVPMTMKHVALLFIQFCRGIRHGCDGIADSVQYSLIFPEPAPVPPRRLYGPPINMALTLIEFLRYLASQRFALADHLSLAVDSEPYPPTLSRQNQWQPLNQLAFRTYHNLAVSGRFDALHFYQDAYEMIETETKDPTVVSGELFNSKNYSQEAVRCNDVIECLKDWSGINFLNFRSDKTRTKNNVGQYLCTAYGTVAARQRIARLLQMDVHILLKAVQARRQPPEVFDMSL